MVTITIKYIPFHSDVAFLQIKQTEIANFPYYIWAFYLHVYTSIFSLIAGFTQFNNSILKNHKSTHRLLGKLYVFVVLFFAAPSGLIIGFHANGGTFSIVAFVLLALLWFTFTIKALIAIKKNKFIIHKHFMYRSFALAFSAVTLRFWKLIIVTLFEPAPMDVYQIIAWLGWIPNLIVIEYLIFKRIIK